MEKDERPSPKLKHDAIRELALDLLSYGTVSFTIEYANGLTADDTAAYNARIRAKTAKEFTAPATPKVIEERMIAVPRKILRLALSEMLPATRPVSAKGTV